MQLATTLGRLDPQASLTWASRRMPPWVVALLVALIAIQLARLTWLVLTPSTDPATLPAVPATLPAPRSGNAAPIDAQRIVQAALFGRVSDEPEPVVEQPQPLEVPETRLNLQLRGVIADDDPERGVAIIADNRGRDQVYRVGAQLPGNVRLHAVHADQVVLNRAGTLERLMLPREFPDGRAAARQPAAQPGGIVRSQRTATSSVREVISDNAARITEILRVQPYLEGGSMRGYRVYPGRNRQQFSALGLQPGDLVVEINGQPLSDPSRGLEIFAELGDATSVSLTIEREGVTETMMLDTSQLAGAAGARQ
ncbi:MAG: type II secretion system protein GspC [Gammaproteobacteria bacterium]|nr:type II secretion system protein GspC [Gammaproteobacteria bacterium]